MNKKTLLTAFMLAVLATSAYAQCKTSDGATTVYCKWTDCGAINLAYAENPATATCPTEAANCKEYSTSKKLYSDAACSVEFTCDAACLAGLSQAVVDLQCGKYCKWPTTPGSTSTTCSQIATDKGNATKPINTCADAITNCLNFSPDNTVYSNSTCTTVSETKSSSSSAPPAGNSSSSVNAGGGSSSSTGAAGGSSSSGTDAGTSSSSVDDTPIISHNGAPVVGLNVVNFARSLRIASDKNATISLFDINGKLVLSQKVLSGTTTISLANQKSGVYYAVAKSSSQKQIVKIVFK